jgi:ferredoxin
MKYLHVNINACIGCDLCVDLCPDLFKTTGFAPEPVDKDISNNRCAYDAVDFCPVDAITIE